MSHLILWNRQIGDSPEMSWQREKTGGCPCEWQMLGTWMWKLGGKQADIWKGGKSWWPWAAEQIGVWGQGRTLTYNLHVAKTSSNSTTACNRAWAPVVFNDGLGMEERRNWILCSNREDRILRGSWEVHVWGLRTVLAQSKCSISIYQMN